MIQVQILGKEELERAEKLLANVPRGVDRAVRNAIQRGASYLHKQSSQAIRKRYAISAGNIRQNETVRITYSYGNGVLATIAFAGARIPLARFDGAGTFGRDTSKRVPAFTEKGWRMVSPSLPARGHVLVSTSPVTFHHAFMASFKSSHVGVMERTGGVTGTGRDALHELKSPSVPQMVGHTEVAEPLLEETGKKIEERLDHEIMRLLAGW